MARTFGPLFSISAHGSVGKIMTFQKTRGVNTVRFFPNQPKRRTLAQDNIRIRFSSILNQWNSFSQADKDAYALRASTTDLPPFALFCQNYLVILNAGLNPIYYTDMVVSPTGNPGELLLTYTTNFKAHDTIWWSLDNIDYTILFVSSVATKTHSELLTSLPSGERIFIRVDNSTWQPAKDGQSGVVSSIPT